MFRGVYANFIRREHDEKGRGRWKLSQYACVFERISCVAWRSQMDGRLMCGRADQHFPAQAEIPLVLAADVSARIT
jgi:uncharacterized protein YbaR (Trm112 family)